MQKEQIKEKEIRKKSIEPESIELLCFDDCNFKVIDYLVGAPLIPPRQENNYLFHDADLEQSEVYKN